MWGISANIPVAMLAAMLLLAATGDIRSRRIPNKLNLAIALLALPFWALSGYALWPDIGVQLALAAGVFLFFALLFQLGMMGGGDVKLLAALALWLPLASLVKLVVIMSLAGGVLTLVMLVRHRAAKTDDRIEVPYGVAIAFAGMWLIGERFLYQFG
jgi:prepilin peptidase CpaA